MRKLSHRKVKHLEISVSTALKEFEVVREEEA
jgi:hypothetical protein